MSSISSIDLLLVDDDPDGADLAATFLERTDDRFSVDVMTHVVGALENFTGEVDCIVSDYDMPGQNGVDFLREIRADHPDIPFILFTGKGSEEVASEAISAGVTDYLQKGPHTEQYELLANRIANAVSKHRAERRAAETERRYAALFEHTNDAVAWTEFDGTTPIIKEVNPVFEELFVSDGEDIDGRDLDEIVASGERIDEARETSRQAKHDQLLSAEVVRDTTAGPRHFRWQMVPVTDPVSGTIDAGFAVYTDITGRETHTTESFKS